jgi:hypothetical protein
MKSWTLATILIFVPVCAHATVLFSDDFEGASLEAEGWVFGSGTCFSSRPATCSIMDLDTSQHYNGTQSLKQTFYQDDQVTSPSQGIFSISTNSGNYPTGYYPSYRYTTELYVRYYTRMHNWLSGVTHPTKTIYYKDQWQVANEESEVSGHHNQSDMTAEITTQNQAGTCPAGAIPFGGTITCSYLQNTPPGGVSPVTYAMDQWYCVEEHVKNGTSGGSDGTLEMWIDGNLVIGYYNLPLTQSGLSTLNGLAYINSIEIFKQNGLNADYVSPSNPGNPGYRWFDALVMSTTRVGCLGSNAPPATPTGVTIAKDTNSFLYRVKE